MPPGISLAAAHDAAGRHDEAVNELALAAQRGEIDATAELRKWLVAGDRAPLLPQDGTRLLADALQAGSAEAALRLATLAARRGTRGCRHIRSPSGFSTTKAG